MNAERVIFDHCRPNITLVFFHPSQRHGKSSTLISRTSRTEIDSFIKGQSHLTIKQGLAYSLFLAPGTFVWSIASQILVKPEKITNPFDVGSLRSNRLEFRPRLSLNAFKQRRFLDCHRSNSFFHFTSGNIGKERMVLCVSFEVYSILRD